MKRPGQAGGWVRAGYGGGYVGWGEGDLVELRNVVFDAILVEGLPHVENAPHLLRVGPLPSVRLRVRIERLVRGRSRVGQVVQERGAGLEELHTPYIGAESR